MEKFLTSDCHHVRKLSEILDIPLVFIDLETTGMVYEKTFRIIEIGLVIVSKDSIVEKNALVNPKLRIPHHITEITHITNDMVRDKKEYSHYVSYIDKLSKNSILSGYNSKRFDSKGLEKMATIYGFNTEFKNQIDVQFVFLQAKKIFMGLNDRSGTLTEACNFYNVRAKGNAHRAGYDIAITVMLLDELIKKHGMGIVYQQILKLQSSELKKNFLSYMSQNKIKPI